MAKYTFKAEGLKGIIKFTKDAIKKGQNFRIPYEGDKGSKKPTMWLVKDSGVYLMTSVRLPEIPEDNSHVCYAVGFGPYKHVGGDDFVEEIELTPGFLQELEKGAEVQINITATRLSVATKLLPIAAPK